MRGYKCCPIRCVISRRSDSTLHKPGTIWGSRIGEGIFVRSVNERGSGWFCGTQVRHEGQSQAGSIKKDFRFVEADPGMLNQVDAARRRQYRRYDGCNVDLMMRAEARAAQSCINLDLHIRTESAPRKIPTGSDQRCRLRRDLAWAEKLEQRCHPNILRLVPKSTLTTHDDLCAPVYERRLCAAFCR